MLTLEDELTAKLSQLQMLETENESLKLKETVLAAAVEAGGVTYSTTHCAV